VPIQLFVERFDHHVAWRGVFLVLRAGEAQDACRFSGAQVCADRDGETTEQSLGPGRAAVLQVEGIGEQPVAMQAAAAVDDDAGRNGKRRELLSRCVLIVVEILQVNIGEQRAKTGTVLGRTRNVPSLSRADESILASHHAARQ